MSRPERLHVPHGHYFVVDEFQADEMLVAAPSRTHTEDELRRFAENRAQYESLLTYAVARWCARVHAYCWLPVCALLEIQIGWAPLERVMHSLRARFSRHISRTTGLSAPGYAGRYTAWLLDPACTLDFHRDLCWRPVRAGLCTHPAEYRHATIHSALNGPIPPFLARSEVLAWLQQRQHHSQARLLSFLSAAPSPAFAALASGSPHDRRIIGHLNFIRKIHREEHRPPILPRPQVVMEWVRMLLEHEEKTPGKGSPSACPVLESALTAWLMSCVGPASVSSLARRLPAIDRSQLERAIDHYVQVRPDLFADRTLRRFVRYVSSLESESPELSSVAVLETGSQGTD